MAVAERAGGQSVGRSAGRWVAVAAGIVCVLLVGVAAVWPFTLEVHTPHGTVMWDCGTRLASKHHTLDQASRILHDTQPFRISNHTYSPRELTEIDKAPIDYNCQRDLGSDWVAGAVLLLAAGAILIVVGLVRAPWRWLIVPTGLAALLVGFGLPLVFADVFRLYGSWGIPGFRQRSGLS